MLFLCFILSRVEQQQQCNCSVCTARAFFLFCISLFRILNDKERNTHNGGLRRISWGVKSQGLEMIAEYTAEMLQSRRNTIFLQSEPVTDPKRQLLRLVFILMRLSKR